MVKSRYSQNSGFSFYIPKQHQMKNQSTYDLFAPFYDLEYGHKENDLDFYLEMAERYGPSILGAIIGAVWGFVDGYIAGIVIAWLYNKLAK